MKQKPGTPERKFHRSVRWLLGAQLIAGLKSILLYTAHKNKMDHRDWMCASSHSYEDHAGAEFWFDYSADTGDDQKAGYSLAYCLLQEKLCVKARVGGKVFEFPRGEFLFIGGDTAYHIADYPTLSERFQTPFRWAALDLRIGQAAPRRPLFGIPGNHDYYDAIDGFNRQFARPHSRDGEPDAQGMRPQLSIPGFRRLQTASYVELRLPFGWRLWGVDCEMGRVDVRQQEFFKSQGESPRKLIVCTSVPTTVFGRRASPDEPTPKAMTDLGLCTDVFIKKGARLPAGTARLDLAGDVHHYARYLKQTNYASVVSGGGGAFLHPSDTTLGDIAPDHIYPAPGKSRRMSADALFFACSSPRACVDTVTDTPAERCASAAVVVAAAVGPPPCAAFCATAGLA